MSLEKEGVTKTEIKRVKTTATQQYDKETQFPWYEEQFSINGKEVSQELLYNLIGKRFHECLKAESKQEKYFNYTGKELVHEICRKERLTFYNYLRLNAVDGEKLKEEDIKLMLNREYMVYFGLNSIPDIYAEESIFYRPYANPIDRKFSFSFE